MHGKRIVPRSGLRIVREHKNQSVEQLAPKFERYLSRYDVAREG